MPAFIASLSPDRTGNWEICKRDSLWGVIGHGTNWRSNVERVNGGDRIYIWRGGPPRNGFIAATRALGGAELVGPLTHVPWPEPHLFGAVIPIEIEHEVHRPLSDSFPKSNNQRGVRYGFSNVALQHGFELIEPAIEDRIRSDFGLMATTKAAPSAALRGVMRSDEPILNANPLDEAVSDILQAGFSPSRDGNHIEIVEGVSSPVGPALAAISRCHSVEVVSVMCRASDSWALAAWRHPHLLVLQPGDSGRSWGAVYQLIGAGLSVLQAGDLREVSSREVEMFTPRTEPGELAAAVLAATGWNRDGTALHTRS